jgi:hypothetical protein
MYNATINQTIKRRSNSNIITSLSHECSINYFLIVLTQGPRKRKNLQLALHAHTHTHSRLQLALHAQRDPLRDEILEVGRGLSLADTQTGRYGRLYSRRRLCARRGADAQALLRICP